MHTRIAPQSELARLLLLLTQSLVDQPRFGPTLAQTQQPGENAPSLAPTYSSGSDNSETRQRSFAKHSDASSTRRDSAVKDVGRGLMMVLSAPVAVAGVGIYACGSILEGTGMILKGAGSIGRKPMDSMRATLMGKKSSQK